MNTLRSRALILILTAVATTGSLQAKATIPTLPEPICAPKRTADLSKYVYIGNAFHFHDKRPFQQLLGSSFGWLLVDEAGDHGMVTVYANPKHLGEARRVLKKDAHHYGFSVAFASVDPNQGRSLLHP
jgi:hypothetical protein